MLYPDKLAILMISHPTPNLLKIVNKEKKASIGTIYSDHGKWTIDFQINKSVSLNQASEIADQMTSEFNKLGIDAYSEVKYGKLLRRGSSSFNNFFNNLSKIEGIIVFPMTLWDYESLLIFIGVFEKGFEPFSDWVSDMVSNAPIKTNLLHYKIFDKNFVYSILDDYLYIDNIYIIKYKWNYQDTEHEKEDESVFNMAWVGSPKFVANENIKYICDLNGSKEGYVEREIIECDTPLSYAQDFDYIIKNKENVLINLSIRSFGKGMIENELIFYGNPDNKMLKSLNNIWRKQEKKETHYFTEIKKLEFR